MSDAPPVYRPTDPDPLRDGLFRGYYAHTPGAVLPQRKPS